MLTVAVIIVILVVGYAQLREGLFTAFCMLVNIVLAGLVAFNWFEPFADKLEPSLARNALRGTEDFFALITLFTAALIVLRMLTNRLVPDMIAFDNNVQYGGGVIGLASGYLLAGFLVCAMQTLPLPERFLGFEPRLTADSGPRSVFPPDRVWLAMMRHAGAHALANEPADLRAASIYERYKTFDRHATFEQRYLRYRRHDDAGWITEYKRELDIELDRR